MTIKINNKIYDQSNLAIYHQLHHSTVYLSSHPARQSENRHFTAQTQHIPSENVEFSYNIDNQNKVI